MCVLVCVCVCVCVCCVCDKTNVLSLKRLASVLNTEDAIISRGAESA